MTAVRLVLLVAVALVLGPVIGSAVTLLVGPAWSTVLAVCLSVVLVARLRWRWSA